jgi:hypothetical protein
VNILWDYAHPWQRCAKILAKQIIKGTPCAQKNQGQGGAGKGAAKQVAIQNQEREATL